MMFRLLPVLFFLLFMLLGFQGMRLWQVATNPLPVKLSKDKENIKNKVFPFSDKKESQSALLEKKGSLVGLTSAQAQGVGQQKKPPPPPSSDKVEASKVLNIGKDAPKRLYDDPQFYSKEKLKTLRELSARQRELDAVEREVEMKRRIVEASEARIDDKIRLLKGMRRSIEGVLNARKKGHDDRINRLVQIYETMKPKDAAAIFNQMDISLSVELARGMTRKSFAAVLSEMEPEKAKKLAERFAGIGVGVSNDNFAKALGGGN